MWNCFILLTDFLKFFLYPLSIFPFLICKFLTYLWSYFPYCCHIFPLFLKITMFFLSLIRALVSPPSFIIFIHCFFCMGHTLCTYVCYNLIIFNLMKPLPSKCLEFWETPWPCTEYRHLKIYPFHMQWFHSI